MFLGKLGVIQLRFALGLSIAVLFLAYNKNGSEEIQLKVKPDFAKKIRGFKEQNFIFLKIQLMFANKISKAFSWN